MESGPIVSRGEHLVSVVAVGKGSRAGKALPRRPWSDEKVLQLRELWEKGYSASEIAQSLGEISRSAVLGKLSRMGLGRAGRTLRLERGAREQENSPGSERACDRGDACATMGVCDDFAEPFDFATIVKIYEAKRMAPEQAGLRGNETVEATLALNSKQCRWPIGEPGKQGFHFCCDATHVDSSYCERHSGMAKGRPQKTASRSRNLNSEQGTP